MAGFCPPPFVGSLTVESLEAHYGALANATSLPILIQDAQVVVPTAQIARLGATYPQLRWVKEEAIDSGHRITELKRSCSAGVSIMLGGSYLLDDLARGAQGAIRGSVGVGDLSRAYDLAIQDDQ